MIPDKTKQQSGGIVYHLSSLKSIIMAVDETDELVTPAPGSEFPDSEMGEMRSSAEHLEDEEVEGLDALKKSLNAINVKAPTMM